jgi:phosphotransferase system HPr (HPr) family protein
MIEKDITILLPHGLHARPSAFIITKLKDLNIGEATVTKDSETVNLKSILSLMTLGAQTNTVLKIKIDGPDAEKAMTIVEDTLSGKENLFL